MLLATPPINATIYKVIDGDTLDTSIGRVRVLGINAPERGQRCWKESKEFWNFSNVQLERDIVNKDKYGRLLRWTGFEKDLIKMGLAKAYCLFPNYHYCKTLYDLQTEAMQNGQGCLWKKVNGCLRIVEINREGEWVVLKNKCNHTVSANNYFIESDGRQREWLFGNICASCKYFVSIKIGRYVLLFNKEGFIEFAS